MEDIKSRAEGLQNKVKLWQTEEPNEKELREFSREYLELRRDVNSLPIWIKCIILTNKCMHGGIANKIMYSSPHPWNG